MISKLLPCTLRIGVLKPPSNRTFFQIGSNYTLLLKKGVEMNGASGFCSMKALSLTTDIEECHSEACRRKEMFYNDPQSGLMVMTEHALLKRGTCCGNKCRHCPYGHYNVLRSRIDDTRTNRIKRMTYLKSKKRKGDIIRSCTILFWNGDVLSYLGFINLIKGDSHLTASQTLGETPGIVKGGMKHENRTELANDKIVLLTVIDPDTEIVPYTGNTLTDVMKQALHLQLDLMVVPIPSGSTNVSYMEILEESIESIVEQNRSELLTREQSSHDHQDYVDTRPVLVFCDVSSDEMKSWKEQTFSTIGHCKFPLFGRSHGELLRQLTTNRFSCLEASHQAESYSYTATSHSNNSASRVSRVRRSRVSESEEQDRHFYRFIKISSVRDPSDTSIMSSSTTSASTSTSRLKPVISTSYDEMISTFQSEDIEKMEDDHFGELGTFSTLVDFSS